jgi:glycosyltransferase involved in cell wall biosynthesis
MRILVWHVHGSWLTAFVQGPHQYLVPVLPDRGPDGRGRAQTWDWPASVVEVTPEQAAVADIDVVVLQRPDELDHLAEAWTRRRPGRDLPAIYLEHNAPEGPVADMSHPGADRDDLTVVHVTHFNQTFWNVGRARSVVIEHGVVDPGHRYRGERAAAVAVINDPVSRGRVTGTDLIQEARARVPVDLFGMRAEPLGGEDLTQDRLHDAMAARRVYFHPNRWTSLGLSLIEAMHLGMPVVALAATEAPEAVPSDAGIVSTRVTRLIDGLEELIAEPERAAAMGRRAREVALERFGLKRFLDDWDRLLGEVVATKGTHR